jgi:tetratricopeptide (TPR) repeat protein
MEQKQNAKAAWMSGKTPWFVAVAAFIVYGATINHWVTLASIPLASKVTGWDWWSMTVQAPLALCLTYPFRFAPASIQPILLNLFAAACAAGALGLLAKAVFLIPQDRTRDQRHRERSEFSLLSIPLAWVPPVLAASALGFQLTFWEHATALTGESLNLLLFAYVIFALLKYRIDPQGWRLSAMALVFGLSMANNWAMVGFFPVFVGAIIWIVGWRFFKFEVLGRLAGWGCLGLLLYLVLPSIESMSDRSGLGFLELLKMEVGLQKNILLNFPRALVFLCGLYSLLPVFAIAFRWPSTLGDTSVLGSILTHWMFRVVNTVFLVVCIWVVFDPVFSPRSKIAGVPFLTFYFLSALSIGYYSGYCMLVFGTEPVRTHQRPSEGGKWPGMVVSGLACAAMVAVPAGLIYKNLPSIQSTNGPQLKRMAETIAQSMPAKGGIAMSDDSFLLIMAEAALKSANPSHPQMLIDTRFLSYPSYHRTLAKRYPSRWPEYFATNTLKQLPERASLMKMMAMMSRSNQLFYLHPPFGPFAEYMYPVPRGLVYEMKSYKAAEITNAPLSQAEVAANMEFWGKTKSEVATWPKPAPQGDPEAVIDDGAYAAQHYSRAANHFGVTLQKEEEHFNEAGALFGTAVAINPDNEVAKVNLDYHEMLKGLLKSNNLTFNALLRSGITNSLELSPAIEDKMKAKYPHWDDRVRLNGPYDEPRFCFQTGEFLAMAANPLIRQSVQYFLRAQQLNPLNVEYRVWLGNMFLKGHWPSNTLEVIAGIRGMTNSVELSLDVQIDLVCMEAWAHVFQTNLPAAEKVLMIAQQKYPGVESLPETMAQIYLRLPEPQFTNALTATDQQLRIAPNNIKALLNKGALCFQLGHYAMAVQSLNRVLEVEPKNDAARMNRAIALLENGQLDEAKKDYEILLGMMPHFHRAYYGLGQIAYLKKDSKIAIENFELYLKHVPRDSKKNQTSDENQEQYVIQKLKELKAGASAR